MSQLELDINLADFSDFKISKSDVPTIRDGEILMEVEKFSFTSNNITYAVVGDRIGYWKFFPTEEGYGKLPCWGFAKVIASNSKEVAVGERFYGYYPMGSHLKVQPARVNPFGFMDGIEHRRALPVIYNYYTNTKADPIYSADTEDVQSLMRPLFTTSFLIDDQFGDNDFYESKQIILTSASSKTALSLAQLIKKRKNNDGLDIQIIGLTSTRNVEFVESTKYYDQVIPYEKIKSITDGVNTSIVDFAGNHKLQYDLQIQLGSYLRYNCLVGVVHWEDLRGEEKLPQKGEFFFAPTYAQKRQKEWGQEGFQSRLKVAWDGILSDAKTWMKVEGHSGSDLGEIYKSMLSGKFDPKVGYMIYPNK